MYLERVVREMVSNLDLFCVSEASGEVAWLCIHDGLMSHGKKTAYMCITHPEQLIKEIVNNA